MFTKILAVMVHLLSGEGAIVKRMQLAKAKRIAFKQLHRMSDRDLRDIGICRGDIYTVVHSHTRVT